jgi:hypothetical protein
MFRINKTAGQSHTCISRFSIVLLGAVLIGMSAGRGLEAGLADMCSLIGLLSVACYLSLELAAQSRDRERAYALQRLAEDRLASQKQWQRLERYCRLSRPSRLVPMSDFGLTA